MCGITGFNWEDHALVRQMTDRIKHRGPDDCGYFSDRHVSLGHRRLSIIDLSKKGRQPMEYEHKKRKAVITFNGEIYNFQSIRKDLEAKGHRFRTNTDTEVILASYIEYGVGCVKKFDGMWAFCIYDVDKKIMFLSRDRIGKKPLYYYYDGGKFIFGSEIKALIENKEIERKINLTVLNSFISLRYIPGKNTIFEGIHRLLAGSNLVFDIGNQKLEIEKFWDIDIERTRILDRSESYFE